MSNRTNPENRNALQRLRYIELWSWWVGTIQRAMIQEKFGISTAQASGDIQAYLEKNPGSLEYNKNRKHYQATPGMKMVLGEPIFEEALEIILGGETTLRSQNKSIGNSLTLRIDILGLPIRTASYGVLQQVFRAVYHKKALPVHYFSVHRGEAIWRTIEPHAFGFDGQRWHVRAFCQERMDFRDFVLGRIEKVDQPGDLKHPDQKDLDWETEEILSFCPADHLNASQRHAIEMDYRMENGVLEMKVRRAMKHYLLRSLHVEHPEQKPTDCHLKLLIKSE
jgi:hypothetical protein